MESKLVQIVSLCSDVDTELNLQSQQLASAQAALVQAQNENADLKEQLAAAPAPRSLVILEELNRLPSGPEGTGWVQPGNAGNTNGSSAKPHGTYTLTPGAVATFAVTPAADYDNYYWYTKRKGAQYDACSTFVQDLTIALPTAADLAASQGVEFEVQQSLNGLIYDYAWQIRKPGTAGGLYTFDKINRAWIPTGVSLLPEVWANGAKVKFSATYQRNSDQTFTYVSLKVNDAEVLPSPIVAKAWAAGQSNYVSVGYQMDTNGKIPATPYKTTVERFRITLV